MNRGQVLTVRLIAFYCVVALFLPLTSCALSDGRSVPTTIVDEHGAGNFRLAEYLPIEVLNKELLAKVYEPTFIADFIVTDSLQIESRQLELHLSNGPFKAWVSKHRLKLENWERIKPQIQATAADFDFSKTKIVRMYFYGSHYRTKKGIRVGSTLSDLQKAYGKKTIQFWHPPGDDHTFWRGEILASTLFFDFHGCNVRHKTKCTVSVIGLKGRTDEHPANACVARVPETGILDSSDPIYQKVVVAKKPTVIQETAYFKDSPTVLNLTIGGCSHFSARYEFVVTDTRTTDDKEYHLKKALDLLKMAKTKPEATNWGDRIVKIITQYRQGDKQVNDCLFVETPNYSHAYCQFEKIDKSRVRLTVGYDIAL